MDDAIMAKIALGFVTADFSFLSFCWRGSLSTPSAPHLFTVCFVFQKPIIACLFALSMASVASEVKYLPAYVSF
jgi:hypothetical protein